MEENFASRKISFTKEELANIREAINSVNIQGERCVALPCGLV
jgi:hypothetical protein